MNDDAGEVSYVRINANILHDFSSLEEEENIILFTPAVPTLEHTREDEDPFEPLGLSLSRYHKRVKHVPYKPSQGLIEYHEAFLPYAGAVIIVIAEPAGKAKSSKSRSESFKTQTKTLASFSPKIMARELPAVLVVISDSLPKQKVAGGDFGVVIKTPDYGAHCLQNLAAAIFEFRG